MRLSRLIPYALSFFSSMSIMVLELVASRLVARHVGASLIVWTSVIGIILAGICLGNVLGGRLADRVAPRLALGALYALGSALTLACLWINAAIGFLRVDAIPWWDLRTVVVVSLNFLVPATVLGMISPVVAKMAVEQAKRTGSAIGDVYFWGAVGSIVGTFVAGFWLIYVAPTTAVVAVVAMALSTLAAFIIADTLPRALSALAAVLLLAGVLPTLGVPYSLPALPHVSFQINAVSLLGHVAALLAAITAYIPLATVLSIGPQPKGTPRVDVVGLKTRDESVRETKLGDLAMLAFLSSLGFMAVEMVAGRLVSRHLGSSIYAWTSVIGVLLAGLSIGNWLGGKAANFITSERRASSLFLIASVMVLSILVLETPPEWLVRNPIGFLFNGDPPQQLIDDPDTESVREGVLQLSSSLTGKSWGMRVLLLTAITFLLPAISLGTVSPVVAKLAVDRVRRSGRTGSAIGSVYAWGMVGSILGTFVTGFFLIDLLGTKGVIIVVAALMALAATSLGSIWHAAWAGIPLGLCVIAFTPPFIPGGIKRHIPLPNGRRINIDTTAMREFLIRQGNSWGLREPLGEPDNPKARIAYIDESDYYYIKVNNEADEAGTRRTLVLDNLIHGYELLGHPNRLDYDYEHIYAYVTNRIVQAKAARGGEGSNALGTLFLGGGSYTFPRYLQATYARVWCEIAEIDPAVTRANHMALGLPWTEPKFPVSQPDKRTGRDVVTIQRKEIPLGPSGSAETTAAYVRALDAIAPAYRHDEATGQAVVTLDGVDHKLGPFESAESYSSYIARVKDWFETSPYRIRTNWGDARQYAVKNQNRGREGGGPLFDIVFGDAFNDFSVPWHLTTKEFNDLIANMLTPEGVYMINIIDLYESDALAAENGPLKGLQTRLAAALRPGWSGAKSAEDAAGAAAAQVSMGVLSLEWDRLGAWAAKAFESDTAELSKSELASRLRRQRDDDLSKSPVDAEGKPFAVPTNEALEKTLESVYSGIHANEGVSVVDEWRAKVEYRNKKAQDRAVSHVQEYRERLDGAVAVYEKQQTSENRRIVEQRERELRDVDEKATREELMRRVVADTLDSLRAQMDRMKSELPIRVAFMNKQFDRLIETGGTLGSVAPTHFDETIASLARQLEKDLDAKKINVDEGDVQILLIGAVRQISRPGETEARPIASAIAQSSAIEAARTLTTQFTQMRAELNRGLEPVLRTAQQDRDRARVTAPVARAYLADPNAWIDDAAKAISKARQVGGFLGSWIETARQTFPHIYVYGTHSRIGVGQRETFVVVASKQPIDVEELGSRPGDLVFVTDGPPTRAEQYPERDMRALKLRSHGLILTDDHAPVDNLLAPVAATRGDD